MPIIQCPIPGCLYETDDVEVAIAVVLLTIHNNIHTAESVKSTIHVPTISKGCDEIMWDAFKMRWDLYKEQCNINSEEIVPHLFQCCDEDLRNDIMEEFPEGYTGAEEELLIIIKRFATTSNGVQRVELISLKQNHGEKVRNFHRRLEEIAATCDYSIECCSGSCTQRSDFTSVIVKDVLIAGLINEDIKKKVLAWKELESKSINDIICFVEGLEVANDFLPIYSAAVSMHKSKNETKGTLSTTKLIKAKNMSVGNTTGLIDMKRKPTTHHLAVNNTQHVDFVSECSVENDNSVHIYKKQFVQTRKKQSMKHKCNLCDKVFADRKGSLRHMVAFHKVCPYKCTLCDESFFKKKTLQEHIKFHIQKGEKPHTCQVCSKSFADNHGLGIHTRIHTGEKPYECDVCSKRFTTSFQLIGHTRIHTGEKPYICGVCNKGFRLKGSLTIHERRHEAI